MIKILKYTYISIIAFMAFYIGLNGFELSDFHTHKEEYIKLYDIGNSEHWQFRSPFNFALWRSVQIVLYLGLLVYSFGRLRGLKIIPLIDFLFWVCLVACVLWQVRYFYIWYISDFDHYPGFDPYLF